MMLLLWGQMSMSKHVHVVMLTEMLHKGLHRLDCHIAIRVLAVVQRLFLVVEGDRVLLKELLARHI